MIRGIGSLSSLFFVFLFPGMAFSADRLSSDLEVADKTILASLVSQKSSESRYLCATDKYACFGADRSELALSLIGGSKSLGADEHLIGLVRFRMEDSLSSDLKCYVSLRGRSIRKAIDSASPGVMAKRCESELVAHKRRSAADYDAQLSAVCRNPAEIRNALRQLGDVASIGDSGGCDGGG